MFEEGSSIDEGNPLIDTDSQRYAGALRWTYAWSPSLLLTAGVLGRSVDFAGASNDFDQLDFLVGIAAARSRSRFLLGVGWSQIYREDGSTLSEPVARLDWIYRLTSRSRMGASASVEQTDTAQDLLTRSADRPRDPVGFLGEAVVAGPVYTKQARIFYEHARPSAGGRLSILIDDRDYSESAELNEQSYGGLLEINYRLSALWEARFSAGYTVRDLLNADRTDRDSDVSIRLLYRAPRHFILSLRAAWNDQSSTEPGRDFTEFIGGLTIGYER